ncbi:hypothetical protein AB4Y44_30700 [Paraburkholderia sp. BR10937]|uniref:hypothetical protein n=1 Tax=Paraburkholderia sp. BR10937 TaxID=3236994 RepID=UPI0034D16132
MTQVFRFIRDSNWFKPFIEAGVGFHWRTRCLIEKLVAVRAVLSVVAERLPGSRAPRQR